MTAMSAERRGRALPSLTNVLWVAAGGAIGGSLRFAFIQAFPVGTAAFPWVVFVENILGALALGLLLTLLLQRVPSRWDARPFVATGILGSLTTFSNLSLDLVTLAQHGAYALAFVYALASLFTGMLAALGGIAIARTLGGGKR